MDTTYKNPNEDFFTQNITAPISTSTLTSNERPLNLAPTPQDTTNYNAVIGSTPDYNDIINRIYSVSPQEQQTQQQGGVIRDLVSKITGRGGSVSQSGEIDTKTAQNRYTEDFLKQFGYTGKADAFQQFTDVNNRLNALRKEALAIPLQLQEQATGRGITAGGLQPIQTGQLRQNAIQSLATASIAEAIQGNIATASALARDAVEMEFAPLQAELNAQMFNYQMNKDELERVDKKRAQALEFSINERARVLEEQKSERKSITEIGTTLAKFGVDIQTIDDVLSSRNIEEAISKAGSKLQDPTVIAELQNIKLNQQLNRLKIQRETEELNILRQYGGLTPTQWLAEQEKLAKEESERRKGQEDANEESILIDNSLKQLDAVLNSKSLQTVVGPSIFSRGVGRQKGIGSTLLALPSLTRVSGIAGLWGEISGGADDTVALTQQLIDQQFLDKLISVKAKGATFGALTDREGDALRRAGNAIAGSVIERDGKVIGYDMSESEFKNQLQIIKSNMIRAYEKSTGKIFSTQEQKDLDEFFGIEVNPLQYYGI